MRHKKCTVITEIGANHQGDINLAKEMIMTSKLCGADYCKFQKRDIDAYPEWKDKLYDNENSFGKTYYEHRKYLEFSLEQHKKLKKYCEEIGINYSCSIWDLQSAKDIISLNPDYIKIPSALNNNYELLTYVYSNYKNPVHISVGMITEKEREELFKYLEDKRDRTIVYWTTSTYPTSFDELFLSEIKRLKMLFYKVGFSGHHLGIAIDMCVATIGVNYIERHFTLDRTQKGTDHSASLEPTGLQKLCRDLKAAQKALTYKGHDITEGEKKNRKKLRNS